MKSSLFLMILYSASLITRHVHKVFEATFLYFRKCLRCRWLDLCPRDLDFEAWYIFGRYHLIAKL